MPARAACSQSPKPPDASIHTELSKKVRELWEGVGPCSLAKVLCRTRSLARRVPVVSAENLTLSIKIAQKRFIIGSLGPKALKYESFDAKGKGLGFRVKPPSPLRTSKSETQATTMLSSIFHAPRPGYAWSVRDRQEAWGKFWGSWFRCKFPTGWHSGLLQSRGLCGVVDALFRARICKLLVQKA